MMTGHVYVVIAVIQAVFPSMFKAKSGLNHNCFFLVSIMSPSFFLIYTASKHVLKGYNNFRSWPVVLERRPDRTVGLLAAFHFIL
jgi:hypothetical protein